MESRGSNNGPAAFLCPNTQDRTPCRSLRVTTFETRTLFSDCFESGYPETSCPLAWPDQVRPEPSRHRVRGPFFETVRKQGFRFEGRSPKPLYRRTPPDYSRQRVRVWSFETVRKTKFFVSKDHTRTRSIRKHPLLPCRSSLAPGAKRRRPGTPFRNENPVL